MLSKKIASNTLSPYIFYRQKRTRSPVTLGEHNSVQLRLCRGPRFPSIDRKRETRPANRCGCQTSGNNSRRLFDIDFSFLCLPLYINVSIHAYICACVHGFAKIAYFIEPQTALYFSCTARRKSIDLI